MELVVLIVVLALFEYIVFSSQTGLARTRYGVKAPATTGHPVFERYFRVQQNTLEQLVIFVPALLLFAWMAENIGWPGDEIAAVPGVVFLIGRVLYARAYVKDPQTRGLGFMLSFIPSALLLCGTLVCVAISII